MLYLNETRTKKVIYGNILMTPFPSVYSTIFKWGYKHILLVTKLDTKYAKSDNNHAYIQYKDILNLFTFFHFTTDNFDIIKDFEEKFIPGNLIVI